MTRSQCIETCQATTRKGKVCGKRARFVYSPSVGGREYLCGQHVGPFSGKSPYLAPLGQERPDA